MLGKKLTDENGNVYDVTSFEVLVGMQGTIVVFRTLSREKMSSGGQAIKQSRRKNRPPINTL